MKALTYLAYILAWELTIWGGWYYAVFVLGHSGWWFWAALYLSISAYHPSAWIHGQPSKPVE